MRILGVLNAIISVIYVSPEFISVKSPSTASRWRTQSAYGRHLEWSADFSCCSSWTSYGCRYESKCQSLGKQCQTFRVYFWPEMQGSNRINCKSFHLFEIISRRMPHMGGGVRQEITSAVKENFSKTLPTSLYYNSYYSQCQFEGDEQHSPWRVHSWVALHVSNNNNPLMAATRYH